MTWQGDVQAFHRAMGLTIGQWPELRDRELRARLIAEEACETIAALGFDVEMDAYYGPHASDERSFAFSYPAKVDLPEVMDGICDLIYVALGTAVASGVNIQPLWEAVHASNMAKVGGGQSPGSQPHKKREPSATRAPLRPYRMARSMTGPFLMPGVRWSLRLLGPESQNAVKRIVPACPVVVGFAL